MPADNSCIMYYQRKTRRLQNRGTSLLFRGRRVLRQHFIHALSYRFYLLLTLLTQKCITVVLFILKYKVSYSDA